MSFPVVVCIGGSKVTRLIVHACLRRESFSCVCFENGMDALFALQQQQDTPSVIFVAATLPEPLTDGYKVARVIRAQERFDITALVVFSRHTGALAQWQAHRAGAMVVLPLPLITRQIVALVSTHATPVEDSPYASVQKDNGEYYGMQRTHHPTGIFVGSTYNRYANSRSG